MIDDAHPATTLPEAVGVPAEALTASSEDLQRAALAANPDLPSPVSDEAEDDVTPPPNPTPPPQAW